MKKTTNCPKAAPIVNSRARVAEFKKLRPVPDLEHDQNAMGDAMAAWAHQDSAFDIEAFPLSLYMNPTKFFKIGLTNEYFNDCLRFTRLMLYIKRSQASRDKSLDNTWLIKSMPLYQEEFQDFVLQKTKQFREDISSKSTFTLCNCLKWPSSDMVKPKVDNNEE